MSSSYCSAECGVYALKFIEFNMNNTLMDGLNDETMRDCQEGWAVDCFHRQMDPF